MKILVVGGTKFFGIPMVNRLLADGHDVTVATRGNRPFEFDGDVTHVIMDRKDPESVRRALAGLRFDLIIDKVAYCSNDVKSLLENASSDRYIQMSTCSVYSNNHTGITEDEFDAQAYPLVWTERTDDYGEVKRQAERAAYEFMDSSRCAFVRYPVVMGEHDYTGRLRFYVDHIRNGIPMKLTGEDALNAYINEKEAGEFIAYLAGHFVSGPVNGCSSGAIRVSDLIRCIETKLNRKAVISEAGDSAPYNTHGIDRSFSTAKAESIGYHFSAIEEWIFELIGLLCRE